MANLFKLLFPVCKQCSQNVFSLMTKDAKRLTMRWYSVQRLNHKRSAGVTCEVYTGSWSLLSPGCLADISLWNVYIQKRFKHEVEYPPLVESELEERFIRGSGPGGQKINKTSNCVMLKHIPTGIVVKCQESRSLDTNRERARRHMQERLDWYYNREQSVLAQEKKEMIRKKLKSKNATNKKLEKLRQFKEREGLT